MPLRVQVTALRLDSRCRHRPGPHPTLMAKKCGIYHPLENNSHESQRQRKQSGGRSGPRLHPSVAMSPRRAGYRPPEQDRNFHSDPVQAAYSQHGGGTWRPWDAVEGPNGHPIVYVAAGSHANYFQAGDKFHIFWPLAWDVAQGDGDTWNPAVKLLPEPAEASGTEFDWLNFKGQWGEYTGATLCTGQNGYRDGPDNPTVQNSRNNPFGWADQCDGCQDDTGDGTDVQLTAKSPVD